MLPIDRAEKPAWMIRDFGGTKEQKAIGTKAIVERSQDLLLHVPLEIDEKIAA